ncbi:MAG: Ig-like domain-containing protein [Bacteroidales bacterium]|nr:Ig-like domain-containing protein [Bacteroidales bacterium]MDD3702259.1 Ig-like domain-containing protein [Bacteroidales bacterium]MDY0368866.1 Ig-like domain-containing protein [Bacteroidales bacterium]
MIVRYKLHNIILLVFGLLLSRCANPVMPLGGEKDITPPRVVNSMPENYAVNFNEKSITITFDEYIKLDKISQQALISPPLSENPEYRIKGRNLQIIFPEKLRENTTYSLFFGNAIVDMNENNPLESYRFIFSTGPVLDSMSLAGKLNYAFDDKAAADAFVMLYRTELDSIPRDSLPHLSKPYYLARADKNGEFLFRNLRHEPYWMYALEDKNSNFLYDKGGEAIAFADTLVFPQYIEKPKPLKVHQDTIMPIDTLMLADSIDLTVADSLQRMQQLADSLLAEGGKLADSVFSTMLDKHYLRLFYEIDSTQRLLRSELLADGLLRFAFRFDARQIHIKSLTALPDSFQYVQAYSHKADTLFWYFRSGIIDSIQLHITYDTLINDTLQLSLIPKQTAAQQRASKKDDQPAKIAFTTNLQNKRLDIGKPLIFNFSEPITHYQMRDSSRFIAGTDTLYNQLRFIPYDSLGLQYTLDWEPFKPETTYNLLAPDSIFFSLNEKSNDTIALSFTIPSTGDYGNLYLNMIMEKEAHMIVQLLSSKDEVMREEFIEKSDKISWELLPPGKYRVKAIHDKNANKVWDTGNLIQRLQPEKIGYFEKEIEIRANWDLEESWELNP